MVKLFRKNMQLIEYGKENEILFLFSKILFQY